MVWRSGPRRWTKLLTSWCPWDWAPGPDNFTAEDGTFGVAAPFAVRADDPDTLGREGAKPGERLLRVERVFPSLTFRHLTNLVQPDDGGDRLYVTEQEGLILAFPNDRQVEEADIFLDIRDRVIDTNREEGLLGLAFDPDYRSNGLFYVYYSADGPRRSIVSRFSASESDPNVADPDSEFIIMEIPQPNPNHNGGQLAFGPDGYLYISLGDGGVDDDPRGDGQNKSTLLGSILRIDVRGGAPLAPPDNPFVGVAGAHDEIWAYGFRNPWRFSFDDPTGQLWVGDVGNRLWEEIDLVKKGLNYGWNIMEATHCLEPAVDCDKAGLELPVWEYDHKSGDCAITGGYVYRGRDTPSLLGAYVYGDFCSGRIWALRYDGQVVIEQMLLVDSDLFIASFGQDQASNLYVLSRDTGVYRLVPAE